MCRLIAYRGFESRPLRQELQFPGPECNVLTSHPPKNPPIRKRWAKALLDTSRPRGSRSSCRRPRQFRSPCDRHFRSSPPLSIVFYNALMRGASLRLLMPQSQDARQKACVDLTARNGLAHQAIDCLQPSNRVQSAKRVNVARERMLPTRQHRDALPVQHRAGHELLFVRPVAALFVTSEPVAMNDLFGRPQKSGPDRRARKGHVIDIAGHAHAVVSAER